MTMKKITLFALLVLCAITTTLAQVNGMTIKGKIEGIKKGRLYLLARSGEDKTDTLGFCDFKKGKFELKAPIDEPLITQLVVDGFTGGFMLIAEPGAAYKACLSEGENFYIKGGVLNDSYNTHMKVSDSLRVVVSALQKRYDDLRAERKFRSASLVNDTLQNVKKTQRELTDGFLADNDNVISAYTYYSNIVMRDSPLKEARRIYGSMGDGAKASQFGRILKERIARQAKTEGGAKAPDFTLPDVNGNDVIMSSVKGKIKIIDFWASWCGPCRLNNPALRKLYEEYHEKGLEIIGVSLDTNKASWLKAIEKDGLNWVHVSSLKGWDCEIVRLYNVTGVPTMVILDEYNNVIATGLRGEQLNMFMKENLE